MPGIFVGDGPAGLILIPPTYQESDIRSLIQLKGKFDMLAHRALVHSKPGPIGLRYPLLYIVVLSVDNRWIANAPTIVEVL
jgi:hypothetical protein